MTSSDIEIFLDETGADFRLEGGDLAGDAGLVSDVIASLFSDARARPDDEIPDGSDDPRGWWAETPGDPFGSRLWLVLSSKLTENVLELARQYATEALAWLVREEIAETVTVVATRGDLSRVDLEIRIDRGSAEQWATVWDSIASTDFNSDRLRVKLLAA